MMPAVQPIDVYAFASSLLGLILALPVLLKANGTRPFIVGYFLVFTELGFVSLWGLWHHEAFIPPFARGTLCLSLIATLWWARMRKS